MGSSSGSLAYRSGFSPTKQDLITNFPGRCVRDRSYAYERTGTNSRNRRLMVNNQDTETGENTSGETPGGEQQSAETASAAGTVPAEGSSETAQPESGWDTTGAGTGQPADTGSTAGSAEKPTDSGAQSAPSAPTGAQLSPNAPRTVKKPADMKPIEAPPSTPSSPTLAGGHGSKAATAKAAATSQADEQPAADVDFGAILDQFDHLSRRRAG